MDLIMSNDETLETSDLNVSLTLTRIPGVTYTFMVCIDSYDTCTETNE